MKKTLFTLLLLTLFVVSLPSVSADMGPKPSLVITIKGVTQDTYRLDLLSEEVDESAVITDSIELVDWYSYFDEYPEELLDFQSDGLYSYTIYRGIGTIRQTNNDVDSQEYQMNYYPPETFKIVLYMDDGSIIVSQQVVRIMFDSVMTWDLTGVDVTTDSNDLGDISGNVGIGTPDNYEGQTALVWNTVWRTLVRVILTAGIELSILLLFKYHEKRSYVVVGITNAITQTILSALVVISTINGGVFGGLFALIFLEILVVFTEGIVYFFFLKEKGEGRALFYALVANAATIIVGFFLVIYI